MVSTYVIWRHIISGSDAGRGESALETGAGGAKTEWGQRPEVRETL